MHDINRIFDSIFNRTILLLLQGSSCRHLHCKWHERPPPRGAHAEHWPGRLVDIRAVYIADGILVRSIARVLS